MARSGIIPALCTYRGVRVDRRSLTVTHIVQAINYFYWFFLVVFVIGEQPPQVQSILFGSVWLYSPHSVSGKVHLVRGHWPCPRSTFQSTPLGDLSGFNLPALPAPSLVRRTLCRFAGGHSSLGFIYVWLRGRLVSPHVLSNPAHCLISPSNHFVILLYTIRSPLSSTFFCAVGSVDFPSHHAQHRLSTAHLTGDTDV